MTEERAQQIVDEVTIALDTVQRFVRLEDSLPLGTYLFVVEDQKTKLHAIRIRRSWLEGVDEAEFRFGIASNIALAERLRNKQRSVTGKLVAFIASAPIVGLLFAKESIPPEYLTLAWVGAVAVFVAMVTMLVRMNLADLRGLGFEEGLRVTRDYEAAKRFVQDERKLEGAKFKTKPKHIAKMLATLEKAARSLNLIDP